MMDLSSDELLDRLYQVLGSTSRRKTLQYLATQPDSVTVDTLATALTASTEGTEKEQIRDQERLQTLVELVHVHLPILENHGLIEWQRAEGYVSLSPVLSSLTMKTSREGNILDTSISIESER